MIAKLPKDIWKRLLKSNQLLLLIAHGGGAALGFIVFIYLARFLPKSSFGAWVIYIAAFNFVEMLRAGAIHQGLVRNVAAAATVEEEEAIIGASWRLGILVTLLLSASIALLGLLDFIWPYSEAWSLFFRTYPVVIWCTLPFNLGVWIFQAREHFRGLAILNLSLNICFLGILPFLPQLSLYSVFFLHTGIRLVLSLMLLISGKLEVGSIFRSHQEAMRKQWAFGRFSFLTLMGTNLLKSADIMLIGTFLGEKAAATYALPLKLIEAVGIPLRSLATVAFPQFSKLYGQGRVNDLLRSFQRYSGLYTFMLIPFLGIAFLFSQDIILFLGGEAYVEGVWVLNIFLVFILFLPLDRFSGIVLDSINAPEVNSAKVLVMAVVNILGDVLVLYFFANLWTVALITILNVCFGLAIGLFFIIKKLGLPHWTVLLRSVPEVSK